jgi:peptide deformylase
MAKRSIVKLPDPKLRLVSEPIGEITDEVRSLARDMLDSMYEARGIGLAAIQIGVPKRMVVMDLGKGPPADSEDDEVRREPDPQVLINPEIVWESEERRLYEEGCLSIPDYTEEVERPARIRFRYRTLEGGSNEIEADGLLATCVQHEIDHLNGRLFIDYLSKLKRDRVVKKFTKVAKREAEDA